MNLNQTTFTQKDHLNPMSKSSPSITKEEINDTYNLLRDFGINIKKSDIPCNVTIFDLHLWRRSKIKACFCMCM